jgi:hypothetical protein
MFHGVRVLSLSSLKYPIARFISDACLRLSPPHRSSTLVLPNIAKYERVLAEALGPAATGINFDQEL